MKKIPIVFVIGAFLFPFCLDLSSSHPRSAAAASWASIGPSGGDIRGLAISPNRRDIYAVNFSPGFVFRSRDYGQTWKRVGTLDEGLWDVACHPSNASMVYALGTGSLFISKNSGTTWNKYAFPGGCFSEGKIAVHPKQASVIYVSGAFQSGSPAKYCMAVFKSTDGGRQWSVSKLKPTASSASATGVAISAANPRIIFAGGYYSTGSSSYYRVYKSADGGATWANTTGSLGKRQNPNWLGCPIVTHPTDPLRLFVGTAYGIYKSTDGGLTWMRGQGEAIAYRGLAVDPSNPLNLYAGYNSQAYTSSDGGDSWVEVSGVSGWCNSILITAQRAYYGSGAGVYRSQDSGSTWEESSSGIKATTIPTLAVAPSSPDILYAESYRVFKTADGGKAWQGLPEFDYCDGVRSIAVDPKAPDHIFLLVNICGADVVYESSDGGLTLNQVLKKGNSLAKITISANNGDRIYIPGENSSGAILFYRSINRGKSWTTKIVTPSGGADARGICVALNPQNENTIYLGGRRPGFAALMFKSTNGGNTWADITGALVGQVVDIAVDPSTPARVFAATSEGLFRSENSGVTWIKAPVLFSVNAVLIDPSSPNVVYAGTEFDGVYRSSDSGATWSVFNRGLSANSVKCLGFNPARKILYAGTGGGSVCKMTF